MMKPSIYILFFLLLLGCKTIIITDNNAINGCYRFNDIGYNAFLTINKDSTFTYKWNSGLISGKTTGKYIVKNKKIEFNSDKNFYNDSTYSICNRKIDKTDSLLSIKVYDQDTALLPYCGIIIKDSLFHYSRLTGSDGMASILFKNIDTLIIESIGFKTVELPSHELNPGELEVILKQEHFYYRKFETEKWKIQKFNILQKQKFTRTTCPNNM